MKLQLSPSPATVKAVAAMKFTPRMNRRLHKLLEKNTEGALTRDEREELHALADFNSTMSLFKAQAMAMLGRKSSAS